MLRIKIVPFLLFVSFSILAFDLIAQHTIKGKLVDSDSGDPLEFANVALLSASDSALVTGALSDEKGRFQIVAENGKYILKVSYVGYSQNFESIEVNDNNLQLGNLKVSQDAETLEEIKIEGTKPLFDNQIDKRVYNVENSIVAEGGTATELLQTLPSIQVDDEGGISMRGSGNILIYINGRPTNMMGDDTESILEQFPANSIKSVELITNPSSKYDAEGIGGIINIILKKNTLDGLNGQVNVSAGTRNKYNGGVNLNYRTGSVNFYTNYNYQYRQLFFESESDRENLGLTGSRFMNQDAFTLNRFQNHNIRTGMDWDINDSHNIGFYVANSTRLRDRDRVYNIRHQDIDRMQDSLYVRDLIEDSRRVNYEGALNYTFETDSGGQKLQASVSYAQDTQERIEDFDQVFFDANNQEVEEKRQIQIFDRPRFNSLIIGQLDYELPIGENYKIEAGLKSTLRRDDRSQIFEDLNQETGLFEVNDTISNSFQFDEDVHAAYLIMRGKHGKFGYQAGLRAEQTLTESFQPEMDSTVINNYFNLFPSFYVSYELGDRKDIQVNYSRRIRRPSVWNLNPFVNVQDPLNLRAGNPLLQPELTDSYELAYLQGFDNFFFTGSVYFRQTTDVITRIFEMRENNVGFTLWDNVNTRRTTGLELINQYEPTKWMDLTLTGNLFYTEIFGDNLGEGFNNSNFSWTLNLLSNIRIPNIAYLQLQGDYRGPIVLPQGIIKPLYGLNVGLKRDLWDKKATISLNVSDVFNTRIFRIETEGVNFQQDRMFNRETRIGTISFTYRFGGFKDRKNNRGRGERDDDDEIF